MHLKITISLHLLPISQHICTFIGYKDIICAVLLRWRRETYPGFEGNQFEDHLHGEEPSEKHVEDVHGVVEIFSLAVMLQVHTDDVLRLL